MRMQFHFVGRRLDTRVTQQQLEFGDGHVAGPNMAHQPQINQILQLPPRLHVILVDIRLARAGRARTLDPRRMIIGERPVDQVQVEIVQLQVFERLLAGGDNLLFGVLVVPQLRGDP